MRAPLLRIAVALLVAIGAACAGAPDTPHESLDGTLGQLRAQFNADAETTRLLMIVAPT